jgi:hypothetical protein
MDSGDIVDNKDGTLCIYGNSIMQVYVEQKYIDEIITQGFEHKETWSPHGQKLYEIHKRLNMINYSTIPCNCGREMKDRSNPWFKTRNSSSSKDIIISSFTVDDTYKIEYSQSLENSEPEISCYRWYNNNWKCVFFSMLDQHNHHNIYNNGVLIIHTVYDPNGICIIDFNRLKGCKYTDIIRDNEERGGDFEIYNDENIKNITIKIPKFHPNNIISSNRYRYHSFQYTHCIIFYIKYYDHELKQSFITKMTYNTVDYTWAELVTKEVDGEIISCLYDGNILFALLDKENSEYYTVNENVQLLDSNLELIKIVYDSLDDAFGFEAKQATIFNNSLNIAYTSEMGCNKYIIAFGFEWERRKIPIVACAI